NVICPSFFLGGQIYLAAQHFSEVQNVVFSGRFYQIVANAEVFAVFKRILFSKSSIFQNFKGIIFNFQFEFAGSSLLQFFLLLIFYFFQQGIIFIFIFFTTFFVFYPIKDRLRLIFCVVFIYIIIVHQYVILFVQF